MSNHSKSISAMYYAATGQTLREQDIAEVSKFANVVRAAVEKDVRAELARATPSSANGAEGEMPVAFMHNTPGRVDVIHKEVKELWLKVGQPRGFYREKLRCKVEHYTVPLYTADQLRAAVLAERACIIQLCEEEAARWQYPSHGNAAVTMLKSTISARK